MAKKSKNNFSSLLSLYDSSGMTQRKFCEVHNIPFHRFQYYHRKRIRNSTEASGFIPVEVKDDPLLLPSRTTEINPFWLKITYPGNIVLTFGEAVSSSFIRDILPHAGL
jgi:hypothetical protein